MSNSQIIPGGYPIPSLALVAVDNETIFGSGSVEDPIRGGAGGGGTFKATFVSLGAQPVPGMPVAGSVAAPDPGTVTTVTPASGVDSQGAATCLGLIKSVNDDGSVNVQSLGPLTLTTAEWDAITGAGPGGLVASEAYFLDAAGHLADVAPGAPGNWSSQVGAAINATTMLLNCPSVPIVV